MLSIQARTFVVGGIRIKDDDIDRLSLLVEDEVAELNRIADRVEEQTKVLLCLLTPSDGFEGINIIFFLVRCNDYSINFAFANRLYYLFFLVKPQIGTPVRSCVAQSVFFFRGF